MVSYQGAAVLGGSEPIAATGLIDLVLVGQSKLTHAVVEACTKKFVDLHLGAVKETADAVRVIGVYTCVLRGRNLRRCRCFRTLVKDQGKDAAKEALRDAIPDLETL
jgi:hypothetical protein